MKLLLFQGFERTPEGGTVVLLRPVVLHLPPEQAEALAPYQGDPEQIVSAGLGLLGTPGRPAEVEIRLLDQVEVP